MLLPRHRNGGQNRDIKIVNRPFEYVSQFKYLGTTVTNQNLIQEGIKKRYSTIEKRRNYNIQDYNFACGSVWL
jgi:hypothetical protein